MRQVVAYKRLKIFKKSLNFQAQKVVAVAYRRWSFSRGSNCKALTGKVLVFWLRDGLREVVAHGSSLVSCGQRADSYIKVAVSKVFGYVWTWPFHKSE